MRKTIVQKAIFTASLLIVFGALAAPYNFGQTKFASLYTDLKRACRTPVDKEAEARGSDSPSFCKGYGGYRIRISYSAWGAGIGVESLKNPDDGISLGSDYGGYGTKGEKIEWRTAGGKPFAVILRFGTYGAEGTNGDPFANRTGSRLIIKGLKGFEQIDFEVSGAAPNANQKAREMADAGYAKK